MEELQLRMQMLSKKAWQIFTFWSFGSAINGHIYLCNILESDRKVNIDVMEASKAANLEEISRLREGNKEYRQKLIVLQKVSTLFLIY